LKPSDDVLGSMRLCNKNSHGTQEEEESCSDHKLILFHFETGMFGCNTFNYERKHLIKVEDWSEFEKKLEMNMLLSFNCLANTGDLTQCDEKLGEKVKQSTDTDEHVSKLKSIITAKPEAVFKISRGSLHLS